MQMSLINMHFIQIKCKFGPWLLAESFLELLATTFSLNELRVPLCPAFCTWPDANALLLIICVQKSGQEDSTPFCFLFTFLPRSVCQSPWRKHGRLHSSSFSGGSCGLWWKKRNPFVFSFPFCSWSGCLVWFSTCLTVSHFLCEWIREVWVSMHDHCPETKSQWYCGKVEITCAFTMFTFPFHSKDVLSQSTAVTWIALTRF